MTFNPFVALRRLKSCQINIVLAHELNPEISRKEFADLISNWEAEGHIHKVKPEQVRVRYAVTNALPTEEEELQALITNLWEVSSNY